jgi:Protein of unknown function (DUF3667)/Domain of unknown function (DUF4286)
VSEHSGPVYEVTLEVAREAAADLDDWLAAHVAEMLALPGFIAADISAFDGDAGRAGRVTRYHMESMDALQDYFDGPATAMRAKTGKKFGQHVTASRRVLQPQAASTAANPRCLNCANQLTGQYCGNCGQRAQSRLISVWELLRDAFGDLLDADSRLWRTLWQLAVRPGHLTRDYLRGRRARYMPPFRTYLVLSLLFFVIAFFDPREELSLLFEAPETAAPEVTEHPAETPEEAAPQQEARDPVVTRDEEMAGEPADAEGAAAEPGTQEGGDGSFGLNINVGEDTADCELGDYDPAEMPAWIGRRLTRERVEQMCERMTSADGSGLRGFFDKLLEYVPAGLFVLLPLMALVLKILYPLSKRYYVEHLLLVVHYHAFVFLALIVQVLLTRAGNLLNVHDALPSSIQFAVTVYIPVYLYKSLRRVYEQGHWLTSFKFSLLFIAYWAGLATILFIMAAIAAFSA